MLVTVFIALMMCGTMLTAQTWDIGYPNAADVTATISGTSPNYTLTISGTGTMQNFTSNDDGFTTTAPWYSIRGNIKTLVINEDVTTIGDYAFYNCNGFTGVLTIPNSVTIIGDYAFIGCSGLTSINCKTSAPPVPVLGAYAFTGVSNSIPVYVLCGMLPYFESSAWNYFTNFQEVPHFVTVQSNDETMGSAAVVQMNTCANSEAIIAATANSGYCFSQWSDGITDNPRIVEVTSDTVFTATFAQGWYIGYPNSEDVIATLSGTAPNLTLTIDGTGTMQNFTSANAVPWYYIRGNIKHLVINPGVTSIGDYDFALCSGLTGALTIPDGVTKIGNDAFGGCSSLTGALTIPSSVTTIGEGAFSGCSGFTGALTIGNSVTTIGDDAFYHCNGFTGALTIPNGVTSIGYRTFSACSGFTGALTIPDSVTSIGGSAFTYCSGFTGALTIGNNVATIGDYAFYFCSGLTGALTIGNSVTTIGYSAFTYCSGFTGALTIPDGVTSIRDYAFAYCSGFTGALTIPDGVTTIGVGAFLGCSSFTGALTIGNSVTTIGDYAFGNCSGLTSIVCKTPTPPVPGIGGSNIFTGISNSIPVYVLCGMLPYFESSDWTTCVTNFQEVLPVVTVQSNDDTMGSAAVTQQNTCENPQAIIAATANDGYHFVKWDDENIDNPRTVEVTSDTTFMAIFEHLDGTDNILANQLNIYPNPAKDVITVASSELQNETYTVFSISGQTLMRGKLQGKTTTINVSALADGVYILKASNYAEKFVKE